MRGSSGIKQVKFGDKWTHGDWGLYLQTSPTIAPATPKTNFVDIPASNGSLDLSEALTGEPVYSNRSIKIGLIFQPPERQWEAKRIEIENHLNGQKLPIIMPDDEKHYFIGRVTVAGFTKDKSIAVMQVDALCEPWRYRNNKTVYSFIIPAAGATTLNLQNEHRRVIPTFTTDAEITVLFKELSAAVSVGSYQITGVYLDPGSNPITIQGAEGTNVKIEYQEASL